MSRQCPSNPELLCPWLANLDSSIGLARDDAEHRIFFGKKRAQQLVDKLIQQRAEAQQVVSEHECPKPEFRVGEDAIYCGILVVNSELQKLEFELAEPINIVEEQ